MSTLAMYTIIIVFFCMSMAAVFGYKDPQISVYQIMEDRQNMKEPLNLGTHYMDFVFGFLDRNFRPQPMDLLDR